MRSKIFHFEALLKLIELNPASIWFPLLMKGFIIIKGIHSKLRDLQAETRWWSLTIKKLLVSLTFHVICLHLNHTLPVPLLIGGRRLREKEKRQKIRFNWLITNSIEITLMKTLKRKLDSRDREIWVILRIFMLKEWKIQRGSIINK